MYESHFGFRCSPFSLTPDPRFLYLSGHHREALAHLLYGVGEGGGFVQLTGEVGTGKTTLCRGVLEQAPEQVDLALVLNPRLSPLELVATVCDELGATYPEGTTSVKTLVDALFDRLLEGHAAGRRSVVVIDEAQNLSSEALEQIRLLSNLETPTQKLLQIVLIGQPELQELMARPELRQLAQRITARYHLSPLAGAETVAYVRHRLRVAGGNPELFTPSALRQVHRLSGGVPRLINVLCDRALLGAYGRDMSQIGAALVRGAAREVRGERPKSGRNRLPLWGTALVAAGIAVAAAGPYRDSLWRQLLAGLHLDADQDSIAAPLQLATPVESVVPPAPEPVSVPTIPETTSDDLLRILLAPATDGAPEPLRQLLALWRVDIRPNDIDGCEVALAAGLLCHQSRGNLTEVLHLNRPVILDLLVRPGEPHPVLITGVEDGKLLWPKGDGFMRLSPQAIDPLWRGSFTLLWKPPPGGSLVLKRGSRGSDVVWLAERLRELEDEPGPVVSDFDDAMEQRVGAIQQRFGIAPDGIAGRETIMKINTATDSRVPRLAPELD